jgi:hypothetical protein
MPWDIIKDNPDQPWDWRSVSENPNISWDIVTAHLDKPWNFENLASNPGILEIPRNDIILGVRQYFAIQKIFKAWFKCNTNPEYLVCRKRLLREYNENLL